MRLLRLTSGQYAVCKDFFDAPAWYRCTVGRILITHECGAYAKLQGMPWIPQFYAHPYPAMMLIEYIDSGRDLCTYKQGELPPAMFQQMQDILQEMHQRQVIHLDIGHDAQGHFGRETNFIWNERLQRLYLIDPAGSVYKMPLPERLRHDLEAHDNLALTKIHDFFFPDMPWEHPQPLSALAYKVFSKLKKI